MKKIIFTALALIMTVSLIACNSADTNDTKAKDELNELNSPFIVTDVAGRQVEFDKTPQTVVAMGHGVLKNYVYINGADKLVGIEKTEITGSKLTGQSINYAYPELKEIKKIGDGGSKFTPNYELLAEINPDVIFCAYNISKEEYDALQEKTKSKVVALDTGTSRKVFNDTVYKNFEIIGQVMGKQERAQELISFIKDIKKDMDSRNLSTDDSPQIYVGGTSFRGTQGILSTQSHYELLDSVGAKNIMDSITDKTSIIIDSEKLAELNPELIIIDLSGKSIVLEDMQKNVEFYNNLNAFKNHKVYSIMPYFTYGMNFDTAILDMYYVGSLVHPNSFKDLNFEDKAKLVYEKFVGKNVHGDLINNYPEAYKEFVK